MLQDVLLEVQGQKVAGYTRADVNAWINHCSRNRNPVVLKTAPQGKMSLSRLMSTVITGVTLECLSVSILFVSLAQCTRRNDEGINKVEPGY